MDDRGEKVGSLEGIWLGPSTHWVEFIGVKTNLMLKRTHVVPARSVEFDEDRGLIQLHYSAAFVKEAPSFNPHAQLAEVEKQQITTYYGQFVPLQRVSAIEEIRPEEPLNSGLSAAASKAPTQEGTVSDEGRTELERAEQAFFNQKGFVTDAMGEVDASGKLERTQREAKFREEEHERRHGVDLQ